jgi:hypothetical protein
VACPCLERLSRPLAVVAQQWEEDLVEIIVAVAGHSAAAAAWARAQTAAAALCKRCMGISRAPT